MIWGPMATLFYKSIWCLWTKYFQNLTFVEKCLPQQYSTTTVAPSNIQWRHRRGCSPTRPGPARQPEEAARRRNYAAAHADRWTGRPRRLSQLNCNGEPPWPPPSHAPLSHGIDGSIDRYPSDHLLWFSSINKSILLFLRQLLSETPSCAHATVLPYIYFYYMFGASFQYVLSLGSLVQYVTSLLISF